MDLINLDLFHRLQARRGGTALAVEYVSRYRNAARTRRQNKRNRKDHYERVWLQAAWDLRRLVREVENV